MPTTDEMLSPKELADYLGLPVTTIYAWRAKDHGPPGYRVGKHVRYRRADVESWLAEQADERQPA